MIRETRRGFTLVEIMIVLAIIGILAMVLLPQIGGADRPAQIATTKANLNTIRTQIQLFRTKEGRYPNDDLSDLVNTTYSDMGVQRRYLRELPRELISSRTGRNTVTNTLGLSGGWHYDPRTAEVTVNYNKDLDDTWGLSKDEEANPSKW